MINNVISTMISAGDEPGGTMGAVDSDANTADGTDPPKVRRRTRVTIRDVAALAGVSPGSVSQVFNANGRISPATAQRVREAAEKLGWRPSVAASGLRSARSRAVALVARRTADLLDVDPHFTSLISGIERELAPRGYGLLLQFIGDATDGETEVYRRLATERGIDGVILTEGRIGDTRYDLMAELGLPAVLAGVPHRDDVAHVATPQPEAGVIAAVEHLIELGHRRFAYVTGPEDRVHTALRRRAVATALRAHDLEPADVRTTDFSEQQAVEQTRDLLSGRRRPTAILYANDSMALCGIGTARRLGLRVPDDVSVVGYDNLTLGRWSFPGLTTVDQYVGRVGSAAARLLMQAMGERLAADSLEDPPRLVVRESTGPAPTDD